MTFLPIVMRELRVASRRRGTYWSRSLTAVVAIAVGSFVYATVSSEPPQQVGNKLFNVLTWVAFVYCLLSGIRSTADCLSEEKREGTLGLLFLTDLKGYDVVGGKLVATSVNAFFGLIAIFPVLAIPLLMGGITNGELWRATLVLANTFLLSLSVGMFMSSVCKSPRKAMAGTFTFLFMLVLGNMILVEWIPWLRRSELAGEISLAFNPGSALAWSPDYLGNPPTPFSTREVKFSWSVGALHGLCWLLLAVASVIVPRSWQDHPAGERVQGWRDRWHKLSFGDEGQRAAFRKRLLDINAFYWLAGRARLKPFHVWFVLGIMACLWAWAALENGRSWTSEMGAQMLTAFVLNATLKFWIASQAGRQLGEDRKLGSLELLLSTPLGVRDILRGQMLALRRQFLGPIIAVMMVQCVFLVSSLRGDPAQTDGIPMIVAVWTAFMIMLVADVLALVPVAMWVSLTTRNPNRTTGITIRRVLVLPLAAALVVLMFILFFMFNSSASQPSWQIFLGLWFVPGILADVIFGLGALRRLQNEFREVAVQRFTPSASFLRRLFGGGQSPAHTQQG